VSKSKSPDKLINAGDVIVDEIKLVSYTGFELDLRKIVGDFTIYEDIYSNCLSGSLVFPDSMNMVKNFPIIGQEDLYITFYTPGLDSKPRRVRFKVYKVSSYIRGEGSITVAIRLEFISHIAELSSQLKFNRVMRNMKFSEMVNTLHSDLIKVDPLLPPITINDTYGKTTVLLTNWSPLYAINWFANRSVSPNNRQICDYLFYETLDGFNFTPMSALKQLPSVCTYKSAPGGFRAKSGDRMIESELRNISSYSIRDMGDKIRESRLGVYSSNILVHEVTTKSYYANNFSYRDSFGDTPHMNKGRMIPYDSKSQNRPNSYLKYYDKSHFMYENVDDSSFVDKSPYRQSLLNQMNSMTMTIDVYGDSTLRVGHMVDLEFFTQEYSKDKDDYLDRYLSGKYMVTAIMHNVTDGIHTMRVTIARDTYNEELPDKKEKTLR